MRYELTDYEWAAIKPFQPNKPRGADRGYDADWIRALAAKRGVWANIPESQSASARTSIAPGI